MPFPRLLVSAPSQAARIHFFEERVEFICSLSSSLNVLCSSPLTDSNRGVSIATDTARETWPIISPCSPRMLLLCELTPCPGFMAGSRLLKHLAELALNTRSVVDLRQDLTQLSVELSNRVSLR